MSNFDDFELLSDDSVLQAPSFSTNLSSHPFPSVNQLPVSVGIKVVDWCIVVENTSDCLTKLKPHLNKVCFLNAMY